MAPRPRRSPARAPYACQTTLTTLEGSERHEGTTRAIDLLSSGTRVTLTRPLDEGRRVRVEVLMPNTLLLVVCGVILRGSAIERGSYLVEIAFDEAPVLQGESEEGP